MKQPLRNQDELMQVALPSEVPPRGRQGLSTGRLAWPLAALLIGILALAGWLAIAYVARWMFWG